MPTANTLFIGDQGPKWRTIEVPPFSGAVKILVVPATQDELDIVNAKVDSLEKDAREHGDEFDRQEVWSREYFDHFLRNWKGVEGNDGPVECTRETKLLAMRRSRVLVGSVTYEADFLAQCKVQEEEGNS